MKPLRLSEPAYAINIPKEKPIFYVYDENVWIGFFYYDGKWWFCPQDKDMNVSNFTEDDLKSLVKFVNKIKKMKFKKNKIRRNQNEIKKV